MCIRNVGCVPASPTCPAVGLDCGMDSQLRLCLPLPPSTADAPDAAGEENGGEEDEGDESAAAVAAVLNGAVAAVVYRSAIKAIPGSVAFRRKFLDILRPLDFPGKQALEVRKGWYVSQVPTRQYTALLLSLGWLFSDRFTQCCS